jgi:hypothetical protein
MSKKSIFLFLLVFNLYYSYSQQVHYNDLIDGKWQLSSPKSPTIISLTFKDSLYVNYQVNKRDAGDLVYSLDQLLDATIITVEGVNNPQVYSGKRYILIKKIDNERLRVQVFFGKEKPVKWNPEGDTAVIIKIGGIVHAPK